MSQENPLRHFWVNAFPTMGHTDGYTMWKHNASSHSYCRCRGMKDTCCSEEGLKTKIWREVSLGGEMCLVTYRCASQPHVNNVCMKLLSLPKLPYSSFNISWFRLWVGQNKTIWRHHFDLLWLVLDIFHFLDILSKNNQQIRESVWK